jgi:hypothetical protein
MPTSSESVLPILEDLLWYDLYKPIHWLVIVKAICHGLTVVVNPAPKLHDKISRFAEGFYTNFAYQSLFK